VKCCTVCGEFKASSEFSKNKNNADGRQIQCKECRALDYKIWRENNLDRHALRNREWTRANPQKASAINKRSNIKNSSAKKQRARKYQLKLYGFNFETFEAQLLFQNNRCAICFLVFTKTPHIDHDHYLGNTRALLCGHCNRLLGAANDSIKILYSAVNYLIRHGTEGHYSHGTMSGLLSFGA